MQSKDGHKKKRKRERTSEDIFAEAKFATTRTTGDFIQSITAKHTLTLEGMHVC